MDALEPSCDPEIASNRPGITTLFLFDYECVESPEGDSVFGSIRACLERSQGVCAFNDTGLLSAKTLVRFTESAVATITAEGGVVGTRQYRSIKPSVAAMWTDHPENVALFHDYLNVHTVPRYQGAVLLDDDVSYDDFLGFCARWSCLGADVRPGLFGKLIGAGLEACHGALGWLQPRYAGISRAWAQGHFKRVGAVAAVSLILAFLVYLFSGDSEVAPVAEQRVRGETTLVAEPIAGRGMEIPLGDGKREGVKSQSGLQGGKPSNPAVADLANQSNAPAPVSPAPFTVQVGSFQNVSSAEAFVRQLKAGGYKAFISIAKRPDGRPTHRVRVGGFQTRQEARVFGAKLKQRESIVTGFFVGTNQ